MRISELETGQVWLLENPRRIGRIEKQTIIEAPTMTSVGGGQVADIEERPAYEVTVTLADKPIQGMQSEDAADMTATLKTSIQNTGDAVKGDIWIEVWCERAVPTVKTPEGSVAKILERTPILQLYCAESHGRQAKQDRTSPVVNCEVSGKLVPPALVPAGQFEGLIRGSKGVATPYSVDVRRCEGCGSPLERGALGHICSACRDGLQRQNMPRNMARGSYEVANKHGAHLTSEPAEPVLPEKLPCVVCNEPAPVSELMKRHHSKTGICDNCRRNQLAKKRTEKARGSRPATKKVVESKPEPESEPVTVTANAEV